MLVQILFSTIWHLKSADEEKVIISGLKYDTYKYVVCTDKEAGVWKVVCWCLI